MWITSKAWLTVKGSKLVKGSKISKILSIVFLKYNLLNCKFIYFNFNNGCVSQLTHRIAEHLTIGSQKARRSCFSTSPSYHNPDSWFGQAGDHDLKTLTFTRARSEHLFFCLLILHSEKLRPSKHLLTENTISWVSSNIYIYISDVFILPEKMIVTGVLLS